MNTKYYIGIAAIVVILAGVNVKLNNLISFGVSLSLSNIEALGDGECEGCNFTLQPRICYDLDSICENSYSENTVQHCGVYGDLCPTAYKQGYGTGTQHSCIYKKYN
jgi:hypothetical protein